MGYRHPDHDGWGDTVAQVIEQKLNGIDGLLYINSTSDAAGQVSIRLTFDPDTNPDVAQMQVQNKLQLATSSLPEEVTRQGITVTKVADSFLQMYAFVSSDDSMWAKCPCSARPMPCESGSTPRSSSHTA